MMNEQRDTNLNEEYIRNKIEILRNTINDDIRNLTDYFDKGCSSLTLKINDYSVLLNDSLNFVIEQFNKTVVTEVERQISKLQFEVEEMKKSALRKLQESGTSLMYKVDRIEKEVGDIAMAAEQSYRQHMCTIQEDVNSLELDLKAKVETIISSMRSTMETRREGFKKYVTDNSLSTFEELNILSNRVRFEQRNIRNNLNLIKEYVDKNVMRKWNCQIENVLFFLSDFEKQCWKDIREFLNFLNAEVRGKDINKRIRNLYYVIFTETNNMQVAVHRILNDETNCS